MIDIERIKFKKTPPDELIRVLRSNFDISKLIKVHRFQPFSSYVTQALVSDPQVVTLAKRYIIELMRNKERYGFLYLLNSQRLLIPLNLNFNGELVIDPENHEIIHAMIQEIAKDFTCPSIHNLTYEITKIELLYFFTLFVNIHLNWITVDNILKCNKVHSYLMSAPERIIK